MKQTMHFTPHASYYFCCPSPFQSFALPLPLKDTPTTMLFSRRKSASPSITRSIAPVEDVYGRWPNQSACRPPSSLALALSLSLCMSERVSVFGCPLWMWTTLLSRKMAGWVVLAADVACVQWLFAWWPPLVVFVAPFSGRLSPCLSAVPPPARLLLPLLCCAGWLEWGRQWAGEWVSGVMMAEAKWSRGCWLADSLAASFSSARRVLLLIQWVKLSSRVFVSWLAAWLTDC